MASLKIGSLQAGLCQRMGLVDQSVYRNELLETWAGLHCPSEMAPTDKQDENIQIIFMLQNLGKHEQIMINYL